NVNGRVIFYADQMTESMRLTIEETARRREKQLRYNEEHGITPRQIVKSKENILIQTRVADSKEAAERAYIEPTTPSMAADPVISYMKPDELKKQIGQLKKSMEKAAKELDFIEAARLRDEMYQLEAMLKKSV
ncbi:MAG: UvrB/UvrC motif-containing protein, partial [Flavobacteriales bacterium]